MASGSSYIATQPMAPASRAMMPGGTFGHEANRGLDRVGGSMLFVDASNCAFEEAEQTGDGGGVTSRLQWLQRCFIHMACRSPPKQRISLRRVFRGPWRACAVSISLWLDATAMLPFLARVVWIGSIAFARMKV